MVVLQLEEVSAVEEVTDESNKIYTADGNENEEGETYGHEIM